MSGCPSSSQQCTVLCPTADLRCTTLGCMGNHTQRTFTVCKFAFHVKQFVGHLWLLEHSVGHSGADIAYGSNITSNL